MPVIPYAIQLLKESSLNGLQSVNKPRLQGDLTNEICTQVAGEQVTYRQEH